MTPRKTNMALITPVRVTIPSYMNIVPNKPETIVRIPKITGFILRILRISIVYTSIIEYTLEVKKYS